MEMSVLDYALDVGKTVDEIIKLCQKLDFGIQNADEMLNQDQITILDIEIQLIEDTVVEESNPEVEIDSDEFFEKVESLAADTKLDIEHHKKKNK